jgi:hypothetical protein
MEDRMNYYLFLLVVSLVPCALSAAIVHQYLAPYLRRTEKTEYPESYGYALTCLFWLTAMSMTPLPRAAVITTMALHGILWAYFCMFYKRRLSSQDEDYQPPVSKIKR